MVINTRCGVRALTVGLVVSVALTCGCGGTATLFSSQDETLSAEVIASAGDYELLVAPVQGADNKWQLSVKPKNGQGGGNIDAIRFEWDFGDGATATGTEQTFGPATPGFHTIKVNAYDRNGGLLFTLTLRIEVPEFNQSTGVPLAEAGDDQSVLSGDTVTLDGSLSFDPDGDTLTYQWTQLAGVPVTLNQPTEAVATFRAPNVASPERLVFLLTVSDGQNQTSDFVGIEVSDAAVNETDTAACTFSVTNAGSVDSLDGPRPLNVVSEVTILDASVPSDAVLTWNIDDTTLWGPLAEMEMVSHTFTKAGVHVLAVALTSGGFTVGCFNTRTNTLSERVRVWPKVSGRVMDSDGTALSGALITTGPDGATIVSGVDGSYAVEVPYGWSGTVVPQLDGYDFSPHELSVSNILVDTTGDFAALAPDISSFECTSNADCDDNVPCTLDTCDLAIGSCSHVVNNAACDNELFCDGAESCDAANGCVSGTAPCGAAETCDEVSDTCLSTECVTDTDCNDGLFCNGAESCSGGSCVAGASPCPDGTCDEATDTCLTPDCTTDADCDDGLFCTGSETCVSGSCVSSGSPCAAGEICDEIADQCNTATGMIYYVATNDPNASDTNPGTEALPFKNPQAAADIVGPGDTVLVKAGTYVTTGVFEWSPVLEVTRSGAPSFPITFQAFQQQDGRYDDVIFDSEGTFLRPVWVHNCSHIVLDGLTFTRGKRNGISLGRGGGDSSDALADPVDHITVRNCLAHNNGLANTWYGGFSVIGPSHHIDFERCEAHDNGTGFWAGIPHHLIKAEQPSFVTFRNCLAYNHTNGGGNSMGLVLYGAHNCLMSHCVAFGNSDTGVGSQGPHADDNIFEYVVAFAQISTGNGRGFQLNNTSDSLLLSGLSGGDNSIIRACIAYDNAKRGFVDGNGSDNARWYNCIAYRNGLDPSYSTGWGFLFESHAGKSSYPHITRGATVKNIISFGHSVAGDVAVATADDAVFVSDYNFTGDGVTPGSLYGDAAWDQNSLSGNPGFANINPTTDTNLWIGDPSFRIPNPNFGVVTGLGFVTGSPCIDAGTNVGQPNPPADGNADGESAYDMGAYEFLP